MKLIGRSRAAKKRAVAQVEKLVTEHQQMEAARLEETRQRQEQERDQRIRSETAAHLARQKQFRDTQAEVERLAIAERLETRQRNNAEVARWKAMRKQYRYKQLHAGHLVVPAGYDVRGPIKLGRYFVTPRMIQRVVSEPTTVSIGTSSKEN